MGAQPAFAAIDVDATVVGTAGTAPNGVAFGDINGDGDRDVVIPNFGPPASSLATLVGDGAGGLAPPATALTPFPAASAVALHDFNADGDLDAVVPTFTAPGSLTLLSWNGTAFTAGPPILGPDNGYNDVAMLEVNGDSAADVVVPAAGSNNVISWLTVSGAPDPATAQSVGVPGAPWQIDIGDVDEDGRRDLAVARLNGGISVLRSTGNEALRLVTLGPGLSASQTGVAARDVELVDVDADGHLDLVVGSSNGLVVATGDGHGHFGTVRTFAVAGTDIRGIAVGDLDGDGDKDAVTADFTADSLKIMRNDGAGVFALEGSVTVSDPVNPGMGDLNRDGAPEILVPSAIASGTVTILRNSPVVEARDIDFGPIVLGNAGPVRSIEFRNTGGGRLVPGTAGISGPDAADFAIVGDGCSGIAVEHGDACAIDVRFTPLADGPRAATLTLPGNAAAGDSEVALGGSGVDPLSGPAGPPGPAGPQGPSGAAETCIAPNVIKLKLKAARAQIIQAGCQVGKVRITPKRGSKRRRLVVSAQSVEGGTIMVEGSKIKLTLRPK